MSAPIIKRVVAIDIGGTKIASALVTIGVGDKPFVEHYAKIPTEAKAGGRHFLANAIAWNDGDGVLLCRITHSTRL